MQRLYELGGRRVLVTGTGPLGCVPAQLATRSRNGECVAELQQAVQIFNPLLVQMTRDLNSQLGSDVFVAVNAFQMNMNFITNPQRFGLSTSTPYFHFYFFITKYSYYFSNSSTHFKSLLPLQIKNNKVIKVIHNFFKCTFIRLEFKFNNKR